MAAMHETVEATAAPPTTETTVRVLRTVDEVEAARDVWAALPWGRVDAQHNYFLAVLRTRDEAERPHVVLVERGGDVVAALAGRVERAPLECSIGYKVVYRPVVRSMTMVHGGVMTSDAAATRALVDEVERALAANEFDVAFFPALPVNGDLRVALDEVDVRTRRGAFAVRRLHHRLVMPQTYEEWTKTWSSKSRNTLKRKNRRFEDAHPGELSVRLLSTDDDYERIFVDLEAIARRSYQRRLGAGFADTPLFRALVRVALDHGWFRAWVLYREKTPIAFWQGYVVDETFFSANLGYDAAYSEHSPGLYLMLHAFKDLFGDDGVRVIDYGLGDADYKRRFGNETWAEEDVLLFAPTARAIRINLTRSAILGAAHAARVVLDRTGATARVKRMWRSRLRSAA